MESHQGVDLPQRLDEFLGYMAANPGIKPLKYFEASAGPPFDTTLP